MPFIFAFLCFCPDRFSCRPCCETWDAKRSEACNRVGEVVDAGEPTVGGTGYQLGA